MILATATGRTEAADKMLERLKGVDGASSGLDADMLDGKEGSAYQGFPLTDDDSLAILATGDWNSYDNGGFYRGTSLANETNYKAHTWQYTLVIRHSAFFCTQVAIGFGANDGLSFRNKVADVWGAWKPIWSGEGLIGDGSTLDADTVDGQHAADFAAAAHGHAMSEITDLVTTLAGKAASVHGHAIGDVTDLQTILDGKAASVHGHAIADTTGLQTALDGKAASVHGHAISDVTDLQTTLDGKAASTHSHAISEVTNLQTNLDAKLNTSGDQTMAGKLRFNAAGGYLEHGQATPTGTEVLGYNGYLYAARVYNAYLADYADYLALMPGAGREYGRAYKMTFMGAKVCRKRCQAGVVGIASDCYGHAVGKRADSHQIPIAVAGWVLAYVDEIYPSGTPLTNDRYGNLTKMKWWEKLFWPERMVGVFMHSESSRYWGPEKHRIAVDGRCWVKVA